MAYFGYCRVSSKDQNLSRQVEALNALDKPLIIYKDKCSGKNFERPEYKKLIRKIRKEDSLYISSLDRLGRNYTEIQEEWRMLTKDIGVNIFVLDMPILNTGEEKSVLQTLISDIVLQILAFVAENERENIRIRQAEGIACAKKNGVIFGRPKSKMPEDFFDLVRGFKNGDISLEKALAQCGCSRATFYRKVQEI